MRQRSNLIILFGIAFLLVGGAIVYLIVSDDDDDSVTADGQPTVSVLVAKDDIPANTLGTDAIENGLLETKEIAAAAQPAGALVSATALENQIFAVEVGEGSTINNTQLATRSISNVQVPDGYDGIAITVPYSNGGAGYIAPGDQINLYGVYSPEKQAGLAELPVPRTELALTNVLVLDVDSQQATSVQAAQASEQANDTAINRGSSGGSFTYFLALTPQDVERVVQITQFADIYVSLVADEAPNAPDTPGTDGGSVNAPVSASSAAKPQS